MTNYLLLLFTLFAPPAAPQQADCTHFLGRSNEYVCTTSASYYSCMGRLQHNQADMCVWGGYGESMARRGTMPAAGLELFAAQCRTYGPRRFECLPGQPMNRCIWYWNSGVIYGCRVRHGDEALSPESYVQVQGARCGSPGPAGQATCTLDAVLRQNARQIDQSLTGSPSPFVRLDACASLTSLEMDTRAGYPAPRGMIVQALMLLADAMVNLPPVPSEQLQPAVRKACWNLVFDPERF